VIHGLLAHAESGRKLGWAEALRPWILEHVQVRCLEVAEASIVQALEHAFAYDLPGHPK
jgi:hypothetical protein